MKILGIDPGYSLVGYAVINVNSNNFSLLESGIIDTSNEKDFNTKLSLISQKIEELIQKHNPSKMFIEELFFNKNVKTGIKVAQAVGVIKIKAIEKEIEIEEITPLEVKKYITGTKGKHPKVQIQNLVRIILGLNEDIKPDDVADAIAIGIAGFIKSQSPLK
ncbi:MAG: crossover junction endodeoxyribonuclease RuvC [Brevinematia bacterium]|jgi:crossover junction endodeoxyribonuclease RuvC